MIKLVKNRMASNKHQKSMNKDLINECDLFSEILESSQTGYPDIEKRHNYFCAEAKLVGMKPLGEEEDIFSTLESTTEIMQQYYKKRKDARRNFKYFSTSSPKLKMGVDKNHTFHMKTESIKDNKLVRKEIKFNIQHISAYGSNLDYLNVFSIIVVDEIFNYVPTCLVFKFNGIRERHRTAEAFIQTLHCISTELNGVFAFGNSTDDLASITF